eukprot:356468-Chlamydomonas_euryale.AAC.1
MYAAHSSTPACAASSSSTLGGSTLGVPPPALRHSVATTLMVLPSALTYSSNTAAWPTCGPGNVV